MKASQTKLVSAGQRMQGTQGVTYQKYGMVTERVGLQSRRQS